MKKATKKTTKSTPKTPKKRGRPPVHPKARVNQVWLKLLEWAEKAVDQVGEQPGLVDTILRVISFEFEVDQTKAKTSKREASDSPAQEAPDNPWTDEEERGFLRDISEDPDGMARDYLANPDNSREMKDLLRQYIQDFKDNPPPPPPEPPRLKLP
jgi:hypothetical protein